MNELNTIGLDLAKTVFHAVVLKSGGHEVSRHRWRRPQVLARLARMEKCRVVMEACGGAHYWARSIRELGHEVRLIAPQFVKPYRLGQKNDMNDALAIAIAGQQGSMRYVAPKAPWQQELMVIHRHRSRLIRDRTGTGNRIRGFLAEFGVVLPKSLAALKAQVPAALEAGGLPVQVQLIVTELLEDLSVLDKKIQRCDRLLKTASKHPWCQRLLALPGIGEVTATYLVGTVGDPGYFKRGRQFAAWVGLVPRQSGTGGVVKLGPITKKGNRYLRQLLIHGARSVVSSVRDKTDALSLWIKELLVRRGFNKTVVAVANKTARHAWAELARG